MFDAAACCCIALSPAPQVSWRTLRELSRLIETASRTIDPTMLKAEHLSMPDPGGARETQEISASSRSDGAAVLSGDNAGVDSVTARDARTDIGPSGAAIASVPRPRRRRGIARGGAR